ncbi:hypothetical protein DXG01_002943 [Tephrocybe rancida]|nr:hypothetical protein DXG01_002943 [Tephrocybe rancida]
MLSSASSHSTTGSQHTQDPFTEGKIEHIFWPPHTKLISELDSDEVDALLEQISLVLELNPPQLAHADAESMQTRGLATVKRAEMDTNTCTAQ